MAQQVLDAKGRLLAEYQALGENGAGHAPNWLRDIRAAAIEQFDTTGFPASRDEKWRFTSLKRLLEAQFSLSSEGDSQVTLADAEPYLLRVGAHQRLVFVNGRYSPELSSLSGLPDGVVVGNLGSDAIRESAVVQQHLAQYAKPEDNPFTALSTAFMTDGACVYVPDGIAVADPIQVVFLTAPGEEPMVRHPRNLVVLERGASATVVEKFIGLAESEYWTNAVTECVLGEQAKLDVYRVQREGEAAHHTATTQSYQARDSKYRLTTVELGGALSRHDINSVLDGQGAESCLYGLTQLQGQQHVDHHTTIDHAQPNCNSWELFNGIFDEKSRGVFTGRIVVRPGAQQTDSKQTNNNLLLSETARADSQPQLEIYADDVKCTHGATLGPIDEKALFYFQSRGIEAEAARNLITYGFGVEILNQIGIQELRESLDEVVHARLDRGAERRREAG
jgi:Fe-S cluster assembly protein SufD